MSDAKYAWISSKGEPELQVQIDWVYKVYAGMRHTEFAELLREHKVPRDLWADCLVAINNTINTFCDSIAQVGKLDRIHPEVLGEVLASFYRNVDARAYGPRNGLFASVNRRILLPYTNISGPLVYLNCDFTPVVSAIVSRGKFDIVSLESWKTTADESDILHSFIWESGSFVLLPKVNKLPLEGMDDIVDVYIRNQWRIDQRNKYPDVADARLMIAQIDPDVLNVRFGNDEPTEVTNVE